MVTCLSPAAVEIRSAVAAGQHNASPLLKEGEDHRFPLFISVFLVQGVIGHDDI